MYKKVSLIVSVLCLSMFFSFANAQEYTIGEYVFTWYAAKAGEVKMDIQKDPSGVSVVLSSPGGRLARLTMTPSEAMAVGDVLGKIDGYYNKQKKGPVTKTEDMVSAGDHKVYFSSSQGRNFQVRVTTSKAFSAAVNMSKKEGLKMGKYLRDAGKMAALVNERVKP